MNYSKTQIEEAIITTLGPLHMDNGGPVRKIASYQGEFDEETLTQFITTFPAVLVAFARSEFIDDPYPYLNEAATFSVIIGDRSMRENKDARAGSAQTIGTYALLRLVKQHLHAKSLGLKINKCVLAREVALANTRTLSLYSAEYRITQNIRE